MSKRSSVNFVGLGFEPNHSEFTRPTTFCDSDSYEIKRVAGRIIKGCSGEALIARRLFYWVRDNIRYQVGLVGDTATETLAKGEGSCTNKANLLVALLRSRNIPAGFHVMRVKTRLYFGPLCTQKLARLLSDESLHTYVGAFLSNKWVRLDATDDIALSQSVRHICRQGTPAEFDGRSDAMLDLDPTHIVSNTEHCLVSPDAILSKSRRVPPEGIRLFNLYIDFLRRKTIHFDSAQAVETAFFEWIAIEEPELLSIFSMQFRTDEKKLGRGGIAGSNRIETNP